MQQFRLPAVLIALGLGTAAQAMEQATVPVLCGTHDDIMGMVLSYDEKPLLGLVSERYMGGQGWHFAAELWINPDTGTWTLIERISNSVTCATAAGREARPRTNSRGS